MTPGGRWAPDTALTRTTGAAVAAFVLASTAVAVHCAVAAVRTLTRKGGRA